MDMAQLTIGFQSWRRSGNIIKYHPIQPPHCRSYIPSGNLIFGILWCQFAYWNETIYDYSLNKNNYVSKRKIVVFNDNKRYNFYNNKQCFKFKNNVKFAIINEDKPKFDPNQQYKTNNKIKQTFNKQAVQTEM